MNLCLIAPRSDLSGGVSNWERILSNELRKHPNINVFFINNTSTKRPTDGSTIFYRVFHGGYVMVRARIMLAKFCRNYNIDVVHMTTSGGLGFLRDNILLSFLKKKHIPSVYHIHFGRSVEYKEANGRKWRQLLKAVRTADTTIVIDKRTFEVLKPHAKRIKYVNNPIDVDNYIKYEIEYLKRIVFIGWIIKEKGIEELLKAFETFNYEREYELYLIGPGTEEYVSYIRNNYALDNVHISGEMNHDDAMEVLSKAAFFVLPSYTEGFPNVILEAMALHKATIATNVGAIDEMIDDAAGITVEAKDVDSLLSAMISLDDIEKQKEIGTRAYARVCNMYNIREAFDKYYDIWDSKMIED